MIVAFIVSGTVGLLVEWALIRHLYTRPLDTLLATWGLSLIMQQAFRSGFGAREVGVELPPWMMGSLQVTDTIEVQINGLFVMGLTLLITAGVALLLFRSRWGLQVRSVVANRTMSGAVGIDTRRIDRFTFGLGCGIAGIAGSAFTMIGSTGPTAGQLYIVDTFWWWCSAARRACSAPSPRRSPSRSRSRRWSSSSPDRWRRCSRCSSSSAS